MKTKMKTTKKEKKIDYYLDCDTCIVLLMINKWDFSFNWAKRENEIKTLVDNGYLIWKPCDIAKITPKGYKRIAMMLDSPSKDL